MTVSQIQPHQQRVLDEKQELDTRIEKLSSFLHSENIHKASGEEQELLHKQLDVMIDLQQVLQQRIDLW